MKPITAVPEALKLLKTLVERGEEMANGLSPGKWKFIYQKAEFAEPVGESSRLMEHERFWIKDEKGHRIAEVHKPRVAEKCFFIEASRSLVPAMVKDVKTILKWKRNLDTALERDHANREWVGGRGHQCDLLIVEKANDYYPAMVELGWWK